MDARNDSGIGDWKEWSRLVVDKITIHGEQLNHVEDKIDNLSKCLSENITLVQQEIQSLKEAHIKLETEFKIKAGIWGVGGSMVGVIVIIILNILGKRIG